MPKEANKKQDSKKQSKDKKQFGKDFKAELKRVIWPTPKQLFNNTVAVITVVLITTAIVFVLDFAFESMNTYGIEKLKEMVEDNNSIVLNQSNEGESTDTNSTDNAEKNTASEDVNSVEE